MEGYLIRIPHDAWLGDRQLAPSSRAKRSSSGKTRKQSAQLLYYELGEGYLRGYAAPRSDAKPVDELQLTSFHVEVNPMYSMLLFEVFATLKPSGPMNLRAAAASQVEDSSSDDSSSDESEYNGANASSRSRRTERSALFFAANPKLIEKWCSRVLNWNRYVFASSFSHADSLSTDALETSRRELLEAFETHRRATWFSRSLVLRVSSPPPSATTPVSGTSDSSSPPDVSKPSAGAPPPKPWWTLATVQTRRISSTPARR